MKIFKQINPVNIKIYPKRTSKENRLIREHPFRDDDKDGVANYFDCKPLNKRKQDFAAANPGGANILTGIRNMEQQRQQQSQQQQRQALNLNQIQQQQRLNNIFASMQPNRPYG